MTREGNRVIADLLIAVCCAVCVVSFTFALVLLFTGMLTDVPAIAWSLAVSAFSAAIVLALLCFT